MFVKRLFDLVVSGLALLVLSPVFLVIAIAVKVDSPGPVFFRQRRVGRFGHPFLIHKFRTMVTNAEARGTQITAGVDPRVTRVGRILRRHKLDELPQFIDVFAGSMSLVGPRPEVPRYVEYYPVDVRDLVLSVRPGITDRASIEFRNENVILGRAADHHEAYVNEILPVKLDYYCDYVRTRTFGGDLKIILQTMCVVVAR
jgi:lipopolysaccharide/colanic/teichoic acid biosynthesis glycosyltransferase